MGKKSAPSKQGAPANQRLSAGGISVFSPLVDPIFPYQVYAGKKSRKNGDQKQKFKFRAAQKTHGIVEKIDDIQHQEHQRT